jgi:hypothetical protein
MKEIGYVLTLTALNLLAIAGIIWLLGILIEQEKQKQRIKEIRELKHIRKMEAHSNSLKQQQAINSLRNI